MKYLFTLFSLALLPGLSAQERYSVVINEIMADPSPPAGLPDAEWIELLNRSSSPIRLLNWRLRDAGSTSGPFPDFLLQPDSLVIVCSRSAQNLLQAWGTTLAITSFPSLDNAEDELSLISEQGLVVHAVHYSDSWYGNPLKKQGGWSLEMIDAGNPCNGPGNWSASTDHQGGTPGKPNAIIDSNPDTQAPSLLRSIALSPSEILLDFDESMDSTSAASLQNYAAPGISFSNAYCLPPFFNQVILTTNSPLSSQTIYMLTADHLEDCRHNAGNRPVTVRTGLPGIPAPGSCIINEILSDPRPSAYDYIEIHNPGPAILNAAQLFLANRTTAGQVSSPVAISEKPFPLFPGDYLVVTEDAASLKRQYLVKNPGQVLEPKTVPSYPDDRGAVVLLNQQGEIVDEVVYSKDWHFKLIDNPEGVALERIDPHGASSEPGNWHSAASTAGFGTPGYQNSQFKIHQPGSVQFSAEPKIFSPDNDGLDDFTTLSYQSVQPGNMVNVRIFDAAGRKVRDLAQNNLLGNEGYWNWNGADNKGQILPVGFYVIIAELFNREGKTQEIYKTVILAKKLR